MLAHTPDMLRRDPSGAPPEPELCRARGNALNAPQLTTAPDQVAHDLRGLRLAMRRALVDLKRQPGLAEEQRPLIPLIPAFLSRQIELKTIKSKIISCSYLGNLDQAINRPDGSESEWFSVRSLWNNPACHGNPIQTAGSLLFPLACGRVGDQIFLSICYATTTTRKREWLTETLRQILEIQELSATVEGSSRELSPPVARGSSRSSGAAQAAETTRRQ